MSLWLHVCNEVLHIPRRKVIFRESNGLGSEWVLAVVGGLVTENELKSLKMS